MSVSRIRIATPEQIADEYVSKADLSADVAAEVDDLSSEASLSISKKISDSFPDVDSLMDRANGFLKAQRLSPPLPSSHGKISLARNYPASHTGPIEASFDLPEASSYSTTLGTYITVGDPADVPPEFRGLIFGQVTGVSSVTTYRVQAGKISDAFYPMGSPATPDSGGFFAVDVTAVGTYERGTWALRLELASAPGVAIGGLWYPDGNPSVFSGLTAQLHVVTDDDYIIATSGVTTSGLLRFTGSAPGIKSVSVKDSMNNTILDTRGPQDTIRSFIVESGQPGYGTRFTEQTYVYDQGLALCVAVVNRDRAEAKALAQGIRRLQTTSGAQAGGFRFSGRQLSAEYGDPAYRTGAHAIALFALLTYVQAWPEDRQAIMPTITAAFAWLETMKVTSGNRSGLYRGGVGLYTPDGGGGQHFNQDYNLDWVSTEHSIDTYFALRLASRVINSSYATAANLLSNAIWSKLWNVDLGRFNQGLGDVPDTADALDCHAWGSIYLQATSRPAEALQIMTPAQLAPFKHTRTSPNGNSVIGYAIGNPAQGYSGLTPNVWFEGSFSVAYAQYKLGLMEDYRQTLKDIRGAQLADGSYPYVTDSDATYEMFPYHSVASTTWAVLALRGHGIFDWGFDPLSM